MSSRIQDRYATAVHSTDLGVDGKTTMSDSDTLGAYGIASRVLEDGMTSDKKPITPSPLAVPLERLFAGDNNAVYDIVRQLAEIAYEHSFKLKVKIKPVQARDMAKACLAWHRNGTCKPCGGLRWLRVPGSTSLSNNECQSCGGTGKRPFEYQFPPDWRELARWLVSQMEAAAGRAGPEAMKALAPRLDL